MPSARMHKARGKERVALLATTAQPLKLAVIAPILARFWYRRGIITNTIHLLITNTYTMAAQQSQGIQTLLEAEKEAAKIVQKARTYRTQKLKDARNEASKEIEQLKSKKDKEFNDFQKEHKGSTSNSQNTVDKETEEKLEQLNKAFEANREEVINKLLDRVVDVKTELHRNLQLKQQQQLQKA
ncbi:hypothetical protein NDA18_006105 [Ustilago nuda]|nr:hypothetical protein NDA18_006105 [Ustilago nuda]